MKRAYRDVVDADAVRGFWFLKKNEFTAVIAYGRFSLLIFELLAFPNKNLL